MGLSRTRLFRKVFLPYSGPVAEQDRKFGLGRTTSREMAAVMESIWRCDLADKSLGSQLSLKIGTRHGLCMPLAEVLPEGPGLRQFRNHSGLIQNGD
jgi:hypothetical protein